ncbi:MAG TPA: acetyl-CoA carboxylase biotin carboxyl carrier protein [Candidatus Hydrogenedentes bacterium]|nr:acetyl-CoA carboxylase biotin carboxyl carrier protein [Candidatus Hydrogenedentota bacterium]HNT89043.1 acetyl-CoA carboxylase biotin carboxyl carrier protein [Candidatus Hydrogenedentota bacterium]
MDFDELEKLIRIFDAANLTELEVEAEGRRVRLARGLSAPIVHPVAHEAPSTPAEKAGRAPASIPSNGLADGGLVTIDSPMVGTFYNAPAPGEPPFVLPGDTVETEQVVCIVEAMKILNEVTAKFPAIIEKVLVENGDPVEYGQPLYAVRPLA